MAYTIDGLSYDSKLFTPSETTVAEAVVSNDGSTLFVLSLSSDTIRQYTLTTPYDISTAEDTGKTFSTLAFNTNVTGLYLSPNGMNIYVYNYTNVRLHQINLATENDLTGAYSPGYMFISSTVLSATRRGLWFSPDGLFVFIASYLATGTHIVRLSLSSAWDVSTVISTAYASNTYKIYLLGDTYATGLMFTNNGATMLVAFDGSDLIKQYALSEAYDPSSATDTGISYDLSTICGTTLKGVSLNESGGKIYAYGATQSFYQFSLAGEAAGTEEAVIVPVPYRIAGLFRLTLTGYPNGQPDVILPVSNINARLRSGADSYLQVTIPYTDEYAEAISDRPDGDLELAYVVLYSNGVEDVQDIVDVALETIQPTKGVKNRSIVLTGHRQSTNSTPASHTVKPLSVQGGTTMTAIVPGYTPTILPADTITADGVDLVIDTVSLQASVANVQTQYIGVQV